MKPVLRLIGLTAPVHDAEDLALMGPQDLVSFAAVDTYADETDIIDTVWSLECDWSLSGELNNVLNPLAVIDLDDGPDGEHRERLVFKKTFFELDADFVYYGCGAESIYERPPLSETALAVLRAMYDMLVIDFPEYFVWPE